MTAFLSGGHRPSAEIDRVFAVILFTDIVESTSTAAALGDSRWRELLEVHNSVVARRTEQFRGVVVKSTGDGILATFDGPARAIRCAESIMSDLSSVGVSIRAGVHAGEVEVVGDDLGGKAVHIGQRVSALAQPGEILVSASTS